MTAQIPDTFIFLGDKYDLIGIAEGFLPSPEIYGMVPEMMHTACYRGYYCTYELTQAKLLLKEMVLNERDGRYLPVEGVTPELHDGEHIYRNLNAVVPFTGRLRLAKDFIQELYIHMGYQKASSFKTVIDFTLEDGKVMSILDRSDEMEKKRGAFREEYHSKPMLEGIDEAFSLDMDLE